MTISITVEVSDETAMQLGHLIDHGNGPATPKSLEELATTLLVHWADGWRRPGSWERQMLEMMGHVG